VDGPAELRDLPAPAALARTDGYDVRLDGGEPGRLRFDVTRGGRPVEVEQYLGASGHLVALREGDLAFLHVHPDDDGFEVEFPTAGRYRLFLQFKDEGRVHTAGYTYEVER
jgi:oxalate decarboxylase/phosphoglucose isomerase-like protein (cupin superfamily)